MTEVNRKKKGKRVNIQFRATEEEKAQIKIYSKECGMTMTDFAKMRTLNKPPRIKKATPEREALLLLLSEVSKVATNVNQIAKVMNTETKTFYSVSVKETLIAQTLEELRQVASKALSILEKPTEDDCQR